MVCFEYKIRYFDINNTVKVWILFDPIYPCLHYVRFKFVLDIGLQLYRSQLRFTEAFIFYACFFFLVATLLEEYKNHCAEKLSSVRNHKAAQWCKRLDACLPTLGSRVRVSVTPCGFHSEWNGVWVGFSRDFTRFLLPQISFHHFSHTPYSFRFISSALMKLRQAWSAGILAVHWPFI